jgi:uncharacterized membrane protein
MGKIKQSIDVNVPVTTAYNQWTQFEEFPKFMDGVKEIRQLDDKRLEWTAEINGKELKWTAEIAEQEPDQRVAWHSTSGRQNAGAVSFEPLGDDRTRVTLEMNWQPEGVVEKAGDALGFDDRQVRGDLERYKKFIESRGAETGAWRGEINAGERVH